MTIGQWFMQNAHGSTLTWPWPDPKGHVRYYHHVASLTLTLQGCRRGVYSVPSQGMGTLGSCPGAHEHKGTMLINVCCVLYVFLMLKHWLCWKYQYNISMFNFIYIYSFIPMSGCEGMGPSALLCTGSRDAVTTALLLFYYGKKYRDWT
jgi:hypothetical protein